MEETRNYIKEYYSQKEHNLTSMLNCNEEEENKALEIKKAIESLKKQIEVKSLELHNVLDKAYSKNFVPTKKKIAIVYRNNREYVDYCYDLDSGMLIEDLDTTEYNTYKISKKIDNVCVVVGYNFELASIVLKEYKCTISKDNNTMKTKLLEEKVVSFMENKIATYNLVSEMINERETCLSWEERNCLEKVFDNEFINTFYGVDYKGKKNLGDLRGYNLNNKSFEIILKTCPTEIIDDLLKMNLDSAMPIHKILGISLETYNKAIERNIIEKIYKYRDLINGNQNEKLGVNKTEQEWLDFIDEVSAYEEDLKFYNIDIGYYGNNGLVELLLEKYSQLDWGETENVFKKHYTLGKFINYVINETINQGYNRVRDFISELKDYLKMCEQDDIKPTLYSSYLKQTHDITSRNHKVIVEKENEEIFKNRYKDFKPYNGKEYMVIAPKNSTDLKKEGDTLNHCVASYIKRVIDGECLIFFLRKDKEESLITLEVRHNDIVQVRGLHNRKPTQNEIQALKEFAKYRKLGTNF